MQYSPMLTDYYQLSMSYGYWQLGMHEQEAVFHLFFRRNPVHGDYVVTAGLQTVIDFLRDFHFTDDDIAYLASQQSTPFSKAFLAYLKTLCFTGTIDAIPEGTVVFGNEPLLRIRAPLLLCQLLETPLINAINFSSAVATTASRMRQCAGNDILFEFGLRRAQGPDGGITASRAAYVGGFDGTSNVLAGKNFGVPVVGTMAHSWIMAFDNEIAAFEAYARAIPNNVVLLVDTYDTLLGVDHAITVGKKLLAQGNFLHGIRLDSGELGDLSKAAREKLNQAGFSNTKIFASGDITESRLRELKLSGAPIDGWGIGTHLSTSYDQPALDMVYKLGAIQKNNQWEYKLKRSENSRKTSDPGILQVKRFCDGKEWLRDVIYLEELGVTLKGEGQDLLVPIFSDGKLVYDAPNIANVRSYCLEQVKQFHASKGPQYPVERDEKLLALKNALTTRNEA